MTKPTRRAFTVSLAAGLAAGLTHAGAASADANPYAGTWTGTLAAGPVKLRLKLVVEAASATLYSLDQGGGAIPSSALRTDGKLTVEFAVIQARYEATVSGDTLSGTFTQGGQAMPLEFKRGDVFAGVVPAKPEPVTPALLERLRSEAHMPAVAAAWSNDGAAATVLASGRRSATADVAVTPDDLWHLGSITKSMTATLVARMVEKGGITWDTTVGDVLGKAVPKMNPAYAKATFRHLLSHHAGLPGDAGMSVFWNLPRDDGPDPRADRLRLVAVALGEAPVAGLGEQMVYCNAGFVTAGAMLEQVYGRPWESLIQTEVFEPLGLHSAGFGAPGHPSKLDQPLGHRPGPDGGLLPAEVGPGKLSDNPVAIAPAGRVHMGLSNLVLYLNIHMQQPKTYLLPESWEILHTPPFGGNYAMGWVVNDAGQLWHNGSNTLWYAEVVIDPRRKIVAAAATNDGNLTEAQRAIGTLLQSAILTAQT